MGRQDFETETLIPTGGFFSGALALAENSRGEVRLEGGDGQRTGAISRGGGKPGQGYPAVAQVQWSSGGGKVENNTAQALRAGAEHNYQFLRVGMGVRRLTPTECERLQGFPDGHTLITYRGKPAADGPRYKAIGNSMAVPVMRWVGNRIKKFDGLVRQ